MRSEILTVLSINLRVVVCWDVTPYILIHDAVRYYDSKLSNFRFQNNL